MTEQENPKYEKLVPAQAITDLEPLGTRVFCHPDLKFGGQLLTNIAQNGVAGEVAEKQMLYTYQDENGNMKSEMRQTKALCVSLELAIPFEELVTYRLSIIQDMTEEEVAEMKKQQEGTPEVEVVESAEITDEERKARLQVHIPSDEPELPLEEETPAETAAEETPVEPYSGPTGLN
jgi:hypothetical protein